MTSCDEIVWCAGQMLRVIVALPSAIVLAPTHPVLAVGLVWLAAVDFGAVVYAIWRAGAD